MKKILILLVEFFLRLFAYLVTIIPLIIFLIIIYVIKYFVFPNTPFTIMIMIMGFLIFFYDKIKKLINKKDEDKPDYYDLNK